MARSHFGLQTPVDARAEGSGSEVSSGSVGHGEGGQGPGAATVGSAVSRNPVSRDAARQSGVISPEAYLQRATSAQSPAERAKYATRGLSQPGLDDTTQAMLLRQLYLAHMEARRFELALGVSLRMIELHVLPDAARQDAARACLGLGQQEQAVEHMRIAGRVAPASRRAFHAWTLGSTLYLLGRSSEAIGPLERAVRWGTNAKPLYMAQAALARLAAGEKQEEDLNELYDALHDAPCGQGYGQFVLGELALALGNSEQARRCLTGFIKRTSAGRVALAVGLGAELARARSILDSLPPESAPS